MHASTIAQIFETVYFIFITVQQCNFPLANNNVDYSSTLIVFDIVKITMIIYFHFNFIIYIYYIFKIKYWRCLKFIRGVYVHIKRFFIKWKSFLKSDVCFIWIAYIFENKIRKRKKEFSITIYIIYTYTTVVVLTRPFFPHAKFMNIYFFYPLDNVKKHNIIFPFHYHIYILFHSKILTWDDHGIQNHPPAN